MSDIDLKSNFDDAESHYDINDYTQGKYDGMLGSEGEDNGSPPTRSGKSRRVVSDAVNDDAEFEHRRDGDE